MNKSSWIPCEERLPDNADHSRWLSEKVLVSSKYGVGEGWYNSNSKGWYILLWFSFDDIGALSMERGTIPKVYPIKPDVVRAWMPLPEPY